MSGNRSWESARSGITPQSSPSILPHEAGTFIFPTATPQYPCSISCLPIYPWRWGHRGFVTALGWTGGTGMRHFHRDTKNPSVPSSLGCFP